DVWKLVQSLNAQCGDAKLAEDRLKRAFDKWWPDLERRLKEEATRPKTPPTRHPGSGTLLEEILDSVRAQQRLMVELHQQMQLFAVEQRLRLSRPSPTPSPTQSEGDEWIKTGTLIRLRKDAGGFDVELVGAGQHAVAFLGNRSNLEEVLRRMNVT